MKEIKQIAIKLINKSKLAGKLYDVYRENKKVEESIRMFRPEQVKNRALKRAIKKAGKEYRIAYDDYFLFDFENMSAEEKHDHVGDVERLEWAKALAPKEKREILADKFQAYRRLQPLYGREILKIASEEDWEAFRRFSDTHQAFFVKPRKLSKGAGISLVFTERDDYDARSFFERILENGEMLIEERIVQTREMAAFHPGSCNTVRLAVFRSGEIITPLFAYFRIGRGNQVVDNGALGGLLADIDLDTGTIDTVARTERNESFSVHPDTGLKIVGFTIPEWNDAIEMARKAAVLVPELPYTSWDLALTDHGWVIVEGNSMGQFPVQYGPGTGIRKRMIEAGAFQ